jgi:hypothetical protein
MASAIRRLTTGRLAIRRMTAVLCGMGMAILLWQCADDEDATHRVLWLGTSIPAGCPYPQRSCKNLGWRCYNRAVAASGICLNRGFLDDARDGRDLSESGAEKAARYGPLVKAGTLSTGRYKAMLKWGYDELLLPYIDGTRAQCDVVVLDHGFNDRLGGSGGVSAKVLCERFGSLDLSLERPDSAFDRSNFAGAFCFLLKKIREVNPAIQVVVCSHLENSSGGAEYDDLQGYMGHYVCLLQERLAAHFGLPFLDVCDVSGFTMALLPGSKGYLAMLNRLCNTSYKRVVYTTEQQNDADSLITRYQYYCPDGVHPHSDPTGVSVRVLTDCVTRLLRERVAGTPEN